MTVQNEIEKLKQEALEKLKEAEKIESLQKMFSDLRKYVGRWGKIAYYTNNVNQKVNKYDLRHNCGCCDDSPLEVWSYIETEYGKVYSEPPYFTVGERDWLSGGDIPYQDWDKKMRNYNIPNSIIESVSAHLLKYSNDDQNDNSLPDALS